MLSMATYSYNGLQNLTPSYKLPIRGSIIHFYSYAMHTRLSIFGRTVAAVLALKYGCFKHSVRMMSSM